MTTTWFLRLYDYLHMPAISCNHVRIKTFWAWLCTTLGRILRLPSSGVTKLAGSVEVRVRNSCARRASISSRFTAWQEANQMTGSHWAVVNCSKSCSKWSFCIYYLFLQYLVIFTPIGLFITPKAWDLQKVQICLRSVESAAMLEHTRRKMSMNCCRGLLINDFDRVVPGIYKRS